ncbi:MAG TPA: zinc ABC transporter substrate-binding protein [Burkholderiales bacterium]|nr:zinc ABC transporter substrate-binding protein [Burkholderiales bacterium]
MNRWTTFAGAMALCAVCSPAFAAVNIFACLPEWAALATELGGNKVSVYQASNALQDPHRIEARPSLVAHMRSADLAICTGAELEIGWLPVLLQTAGNQKVQPGQPGFIAAADFVERLEVPTRLDRADGDVHPGGNPHIQLDPRNIAKVGLVLTQRLEQIDAGNTAYYESRSKDFQDRWAQAIPRWEKDAAPLKGLRVVPYHKDSVYLIKWLGLVEVMDIEPKPGIPPSAGHLSELVGRLKGGAADLIVRSAYQDPKAATSLAEKTNLPAVELPYTVGGTPGAKDLFGLFDDSIARLKAVKK